MKHSKFTFLIIAMVIALTGCMKTASIIQPTVLKIRIHDNGTGAAAIGATVKLYTSQTDWLNGTNIIATSVTDGNGEVTFGGLASKRYFWYASIGCRENYFENSATAMAIPAQQTTVVTGDISSTGYMKFINNSTNPYQISVSGVILIENMAGGSTAIIKFPAGAYTNIRVLQLSGYVLTPTDKTYAGPVTCGNTLITTFP